MSSTGSAHHVRISAKDQVGQNIRHKKDYTRQKSLEKSIWAGSPKRLVDTTTYEHDTLNCRKYNSVDRA